MLRALQQIGHVLRRRCTAGCWRVRRVVFDCTYRWEALAVRVARCRYWPQFVKLNDPCGLQRTAAYHAAVVHERAHEQEREYMGAGGLRPYTARRPVWVRDFLASTALRASATRANGSIGLTKKPSAPSEDKRCQSGAPPEAVTTTIGML